jgi:histidinol-phosphatase (PHP family)
MIADFHIHTPLCKHAAGEPAEYMARAKALGLKEICLTDHAPAPDGYDPTNRMEIDSFPEYRRIFEELSSNAPIPILWGIEADYYRGNDGFLERWLPEQHFDFVLGSIHYIGTWGFDNPEEINTWKAATSEKVEAFWREYFGLVSELAQTGLFDAVAHLDLPKKFCYRPAERVIPEIVSPALDSIAEAEMAIEINTSGLRRPVHEMYPSLQVLELAKARDIPIVFGSDAHRPQDVGADFARAIQLASDAGYKEYVTYRERKMIREAIPSLKKPNQGPGY